MRNITSRELSRRTAKLLDEIEVDGSALVVIRFGRPAAVIVPFEEVATRPHLPRVTELGDDLTLWPQDDELEALDEIDESQSRVLVEVGACEMLYWTPSQCDLPPRELAITLGNLELAGLLERGPGASWNLTVKGVRVVRGLDSGA